MASKTVIALYFLIALAVAASDSVQENEIDDSNALSVEKNQISSKQFVSNVINQLNEYDYKTTNLKQFQ